MLTGPKSARTAHHKIIHIQSHVTHAHTMLPIAGCNTNICLIYGSIASGTMIFFKQKYGKWDKNKWEMCTVNKTNKQRNQHKVFGRWSLPWVRRLLCGLFHSRLRSHLRRQPACCRWLKPAGAAHGCRRAPASQASVAHWELWQDVGHCDGQCGK